MPGYVMHLAVCEEIIRRHGMDDEACKAAFRIASIVPDAVDTTKKKISHIWTGDIEKKFVRRPDIDSFRKNYGSYMNNPFVYGYYIHLLMDCYYLDGYWAKHFRFYDREMKPATLYDDVKFIKLDGKKVYSREEFFSDKYYYGDYDRMNNYIIQKYNISYLKIKESADIFFAEDNKYAKAVDYFGLDVDFLKKRVYEMIDVMNYTAGDEPKVLDLGEMLELINKISWQA